MYLITHGKPDKSNGPTLKLVQFTRYNATNCILVDKIVNKTVLITLFIPEVETTKFSAVL